MGPPVRLPALRRRPSEAGCRETAGGAVRIEEGGWLPLEDGVLVYFEPGRTYRSGDFWTVPARTATGSVEWPTDAARRPLLRSPKGSRCTTRPWPGCCRRRPPPICA
ncbi:DUF6519 domain-containing protein [Streptomyces sp. M10(2022)]